MQKYGFDLQGFRILKMIHEHILTTNKFRSQCVFFLLFSCRASILFYFAYVSMHIKVDARDFYTVHTQSQYSFVAFVVLNQLNSHLF